MKSFSNDADILRHETILFGDLHLRVQVLASGAGGIVSGTSFIVPGASFVSAGVESGHVIFLQRAGTIDGFYEVVSVDSQTQLTVSVLRSDRNEPAKAPPEATEVSYRVCSYSPQAHDVFLRLCAHFGITAAQAATIPDTTTLRRASVYLTLATVFASIASREGFEQEYLDKSDRYTEMFLQAVEACEFAANIDGNPVRKSGSDTNPKRR